MMKLLQGLFPFLFFVALLSATQVGCTSAQQRPKSNNGSERSAAATLQPLFPLYTFRGHIYSEGGGDASLIRVAVLDHNGTVYATLAGYDGRYEFTLSGEDANRVNQFMISDRDYDTLTQKFDRYQLQNQLIVNNFKVNLPPPKYRVHWGHDSWGRVVSGPDTIWIDENGKRLPALPKQE
jgi:hypothetical protein